MNRSKNYVIYEDGDKSTDMHDEEAIGAKLNFVSWVCYIVVFIIAFLIIRWCFQRRDRLTPFLVLIFSRYETNVVTTSTHIPNAGTTSLALTSQQNVQSLTNWDNNDRYMVQYPDSTNTPAMLQPTSTQCHPNNPFLDMA